MKSIKKEKKGKKGNLLMANVVYLLLVLAFFAILFIFVNKQTSSYGAVEEKSAKQIALAIDAADPETEIILNVDDIIKKKDENFKGQVITIDSSAGFVRVQLSAKSGYSYGFFNKLPVSYSVVNENDVSYLKMGIGRSK